MARKKEPERIDQNKAKIMESAKSLFLQKGIRQTSMEDIAGKAHICKATLYTCYPNRDAIKNDISLEAMQYLYQILLENTQAEAALQDNFLAVCKSLLDFRDKYPLNFQIIVENICIDDTILSEDQTLRSIYETGEKINNRLLEIFAAAFQKRSRAEVVEMIFELWGSICGLILIAGNKTDYIEKATGRNREQFLHNGFMRLYSQIRQDPEV